MRWLILQSAISLPSVTKKAEKVMRMLERIAAISVLGFGLLIGDNAMAGDVVKGQKIFKRCKACHYVDKEKNKTGPHLVAVIGRAAASIEGYKYSKAMKASNLVWNEETLPLYPKAPKKFVKGTKMAFAGLKKSKDIADIIAYLKGAE